MFKIILYFLDQTRKIQKNNLNQELGIVSRDEINVDELKQAILLNNNKVQKGKLK